MRAKNQSEVTYGALGFFRQMIASLNSPGFAIAAIFLASSRILQLATFFIPIKVLILLKGGEKNYLSHAQSYLPEGYIVYIIMAIVPLLYIGYMALGVAHRQLLDKDISHKKIKKMTTIVAYGTSAPIGAVYKRVSNMYSDSIIVICAVAASAAYDPIYFLFIILLVACSHKCIEQYTYNTSDTHRISWFKLHRRQFVEYICSACFLLSFSALAVAVINFEHGIYSTIFILLLSRTLFQALQRFSLENIAAHDIFLKAKKKQ